MLLMFVEEFEYDLERDAIYLGDGVDKFHVHDFNGSANLGNAWMEISFQGITHLKVHRLNWCLRVERFTTTERGNSPFHSQQLNR